MTSRGELGGFTRGDNSSAADVKENKIRDLLHSRSPQPRSGWGRKLFYIVGGLIGLGVVFEMFGGGGSSNNFEVERDDILRSFRDGQIVNVTNVGTKTIRLTGNTVNDRVDCMAMDGNQPANVKTFQPRDLRVGDRIQIVSRCRVIRITLETDDGSYSYSFAQ